MDHVGAIERPMMEYSFPTADGTISRISLPTVQANNFEIKPSIFQIIRLSVQFSGLPEEDPNKHLSNFLEICDNFKFNGVSDDAVRLRYFPFSLCDTAKDWLQSLPAGGTIMKKLPSEAFNIIDKIATNLYSYGLERIDRRVTGVHSVDEINTFSAQMAALTQKVDNLGLLYGMSNFNPYSKTYNPGWRNHPNFSSSNNQQQGPLGYQQPRQQPPQEKKNNLEDMLSNFITAANTRFQNQDAFIRNLEVQVGQLVSIVSGRKEGQLPSDTEKNPREQDNTITLKHGKTNGDEPPKEQKEGAQIQKEEEIYDEITGSPPKLNLNAIPPYIPYPKRILKANLDKKFGNFLEIFKKIHVNIPLIDALLQMPSYAKFLKEAISNKRKWEDGETVKLNEEYSAILQNKLPPKLKDPGSFSIPCTIGESNFDKALCDLGASINLMPYSIFKKHGMHELTPTIVTLQLADRSIKYHRGIIEDVLVKVGKFVISVDFVVLDMEEDTNTPLVLDAGRGDTIPKPRRYLPLDGPSSPELKPSIEKPPSLELKPLPSHLKYVFLESDSSLPIIISSDLTIIQEEKMKRVLKEHVTAIGWSIADIKGISPVTCTHKILMEEAHKPKAQPQRRLNPNMQEEFDLEIRNRKGSENTMADHLSRLNRAYMEYMHDFPLRDEFPDEHLYAINAKASHDLLILLTFLQVMQYPLI
ncbi:UNVERIFIED_CONTAM: hypothetical protein Slati_2252900 [Sesamum latifolium]|uniref:Retrotransposon gag domain-containing protein n=1 Tax=Sesamum latifolium TaxID=2727402 RepID=A0AAW2WTW3_9LAMI